MEELQSREIQYRDGTVMIRPCSLEDAAGVHEAVRESLAELLPFMPWCHEDYSMEDSRSYLELCEAAWVEGSEYGFAIFDSKDHAFLGLCGINHINVVLRIGNLGYWVRTGKTGNSVATSATKLLARFGFEELGFQRLEIVVDPDNMASRRVAEKSGAREEGLLRNRIRFKEENRDAVMYSLIPEDLD